MVNPGEPPTPFLPVLHSACARELLRRETGNLHAPSASARRAALSRFSTVEFGRQAIENAQRLGKKPATFDFLGFTHICARSRRGKFTVYVRTMRKRLRRGLKAVALWCQEHRHDPVGVQQKTLNAKLRGHYYQYYGRPTNYQGIGKFYRKIRYIWRTWLSRRTRGAKMTWEKYEALLRQHPLLPPRIMHSWAKTGRPV